MIHCLTRGDVFRRGLFLLVGIFIPVALVAAQAQAQLDAADQLPRPMSETPASVRFERLGLEDGLAQETAMDIIQDERGFIWIATQAGLHSYDGHEMKVYMPAPFDTTTLSSGTIRSIAESRDGDLWLATNDAGLDRFDPATGKATHYRHNPNDTASLSSDLLSAVLRTNSGDVWVATADAGVDRMSADVPGRFEHFRHDPDDPSTLSSNSVWFLTEDSDGFIWAATANGASRIDPETGDVKRFLYDPEITAIGRSPATVYVLYHPPASPDIMWLGTSNGLVRFNVATGEQERFLIEPNDAGTINPLNRIYEIIPDPEDPSVLWGAGNGTGLIRFDTRTETFATYGNDPEDPHSLSNNVGWSLMADNSGMMWLGTQHGLNRFNPGSIDFTHFRHDPEDPQSLAPGTVFAMYEDRSGSLWVSTTTSFSVGFLTKIDGRSGRVTRYKAGAQGSIQPRHPEYITEDANGNVWAAHHGLSRIDADDGSVTGFTHSADEPDALRRNYVLWVEPMRADSSVLWVAGWGGLERFDTRSGRFTRIPVAAEFDVDDFGIRKGYEDRAGTLWLAASHGLFRMEDGHVDFVVDYAADDTTSLSSNLILDILERENEPGVLWLATVSGLNRYDAQTGLVTHYMEEDGLPNDVVYGILEDERGTLWVSTNSGISNFDPETETFRNYGLDDGLMALEYNEKAFAEGAGGVMYFGSAKGVTAFSPENLGTNPIPPQVALTRFRLFNKPVQIGPGSLLEQSLDKTDEITLSHDQNEVTFEYTALHFENPEKNHYAYRLDGHDDDWIEAGNLRTASYTNLAPGTYMFRVKAANSDGVWNEEGASIRMRITPPWWRTMWAYMGFGLVFVGAVVGVDRTQRRHLARKEGERAKIREAQLRAEAQQRRRKDAENLSEIGKAITSTLSIREVIDTVYEHVNALMDASVFGIGLYNAERERLDFFGMKEKGETLPRFTNDLDDDSRPAVWCFKNQEPFVVGDYASEYQRYLPGRKAPLHGDDPASIIYLPLVHKGRTVGVITTQSFEKDAYSEYHISVLETLATYTAIALDNAESYRQLSAALEDLRTTQERLVQQEKLASLGALTAGIAHEIKNPLNFVTNFAGLCRELATELREEKDPEEIEAILSDLIGNTAKIEEHGKRADSIVRSMMEHARGGSGEKETVDLNALVDEHADLAYHGKRAQVPDFSVGFERDFDETVGSAEVAPQDFGRVVLNLIGNAFDAVREKAEQAGDGYHPHVMVSTRRVNGQAQIHVSDNGAGIPEDIRQRIFEPFFTTKPSGSGTGLGLSLSHDIIAHGHGGSLTVESEEGEGTTFIISVPDVAT